MSLTMITSPTWSSITIMNSSANIRNNSPKITNLPKLSSQEKVNERVLNHQASRLEKARGKKSETACVTSPRWNLDEGYDRCIEMVSKDLTSIITNLPEGSTFTLGVSPIVEISLKMFMKKEHLKAGGALAVWGRRADEIVDGSDPIDTKIANLQKWEQRLVDIFRGNMRDICDAALYDTVTRYQIDIQLFQDMMEGMKSDLKKRTYESFDELYLYSYYVAGAPLLMFIQAIGFEPKKATLESLYDSIVSYAVALQVTDILRDVAEDARMGRIYLPQDELQSAGISSDDILNGRMTDKWRLFMKAQIERVRTYFKESELFLTELEPQERWLFWWFALMCKELLDDIEANDYDFTRETSVGIKKLFKTLFLAQGRTLGPQIFNLP